MGGIRATITLEVAPPASADAESEEDTNDGLDANTRSLLRSVKAAHPELTDEAALELTQVAAALLALEPGPLLLEELLSKARTAHANAHTP